MMIKIKNVLMTIMRITAVKYNKEKKILKTRGNIEEFYFHSYT